MKMAFSIDIAVVIAYFAGMIGIGAYAARRTGGALEEYIVAGKKLGYALFIPMMAAVLLGGACTVGSGRLGYEFGISGAWFTTIISIGFIANGLIVARKIGSWA